MRTKSLTNSPFFMLSAVLTLSASLAACKSTPEEPESLKLESTASKPAAPSAAAAQAPRPGGDPLQGKFTLQQATEGLAKEGKLLAAIETSLGTMTCEMYEDKAPTTVANFVGLARGLRPFQDKGEWVKRPAYDGTTFHRVIKGFMIQGGDPAGNGSGEPGYVIPDEMWGGKHDQRGLLCMANRGPNTNGMQFFITDAAAAHLDQSYTIFGKCGPESVLDKLASVDTYETKRMPGGRPDRPLEPPKIISIKVERK